MRQDLSDSVHHRPRALVRAKPEHPLNLGCGDALLARAHQVPSYEPEAQRDMAVLEDRSERDRELLAAFRALEQAFADLLGLVRLDSVEAVLAAVAAMRADRTLRPAHRFQVSPRIFLGAKLRHDLGER